MLSREEEVFLEVARYQTALFIADSESGPSHRKEIEAGVSQRSRWTEGGDEPVVRLTRSDPGRVDELKRRYREQRGRRNAERR